MHFAKDNGFFTPEVIELNLEYETEERVKSIKATEIKWEQGKDPRKKKVKKTQDVIELFTNTKS